MQQQPVEPPDEYLPRFVNLLSLRLIDVTMKDITSGNAVRQRFGRRFMRSERFEAVCLWANLEPGYVRLAIRNRSRQ